MKNYNISHDLICSIKGLSSNATSAVFNNGSIGEWFQASVGVRQGYLLSPTLFNIFLCGKVCCVAAVVKDSGFLSLGVLRSSIVSTSYDLLFTISVSSTRDTLFLYRSMRFAVRYIGYNLRLLNYVPPQKFSLIVRVLSSKFVRAAHII